MGGGLGISPNLWPHTQGGPQTGLIRACLLRKETGQSHKSSHVKCSRLMLLTKGSSNWLPGGVIFLRRRWKKYLLRALGLGFSGGTLPIPLLNLISMILTPSE